MMYLDCTISDSNDSSSTFQRQRRTPHPLHQASLAPELLRLSGCFLPTSIGIWSIIVPHWSLVVRFIVGWFVTGCFDIGSFIVGWFIWDKHVPGRLAFSKFCARTAETEQMGLSASAAGSHAASHRHFCTHIQQDGGSNDDDSKHATFFHKI